MVGIQENFGRYPYQLNKDIGWNRVLSACNTWGKLTAPQQQSVVAAVAPLEERLIIGVKLHS